MTSLQLMAQERCGAEVKLAEYVDSHPGFKDTRIDIEEQIENWIENNRVRSQAIITIPVVVHVVYKSSIQNISYEQIISQIDVLNKDYRRLNSDASQTPGGFQGVAADVEVEFCLASVDPDGNWTSGITRTETSVNSWNGSDLVKSTANGGKDGWDHTKYLNVWVCNIGGGYLGYAYPPGVSPSLDGVVIGYKYFGTLGTAQSPYNKGRTLTHEIGHWLNLEHLWGVGESNPNCSADDNVSDTPKQADPNFDCPNFPHITCNNGVNGDMFMNYMDYTDDVCMNMFTNGQKLRMLAVLNGARASIKNSNVGCNTVGVDVKEGLANNLMVYPNPSSDILYIEAIGKNQGILNYRIINAVGELVKRGDINYNSANSLSVNEIPSGVYFLEIYHNGERAVKKVIISR